MSKSDVTVFENKKKSLSLEKVAKCSHMASDDLKRPLMTSNSLRFAFQMKY